MCCYACVFETYEEMSVVVSVDENSLGFKARGVGTQIYRWQTHLYQSFQV